MLFLHVTPPLHSLYKWSHPLLVERVGESAFGKGPSERSLDSLYSRGPLAGPLGIEPVDNLAKRSNAP